jgi:hypothetical protein
MIQMRRVNRAGCHGFRRDGTARLQKIYNLMILCHLHALTCQSPRMPITPNANLTAG